MLAFHYDHLTLALPPGHRFPQSKYQMLRERVEREPGVMRPRVAEAAGIEALALVHTPDYIDAVMHGTLSAAAQREIGFPWGPALPRRSLCSVGATIAAARAALEEGVAASLAGGTHHAYADKGSGFCVFNDVAVAARLMQAEWHRRHPGRPGLRVLVVDLDVHQGNGTASIFQDDDSVFTFSVHGEKNFPFRKEASDLDVGLPDACGDAVYLDALQTALAEVWRRLADRPPGLAFYLAGADPHEGDRLGRLKLSADGLLRRDRMVLDALVERRIPVALSMAGGYGEDLAVTVEVQMRTLGAAAQAWARWRDSSPRDT
ncbi:Acetoin utilization deacetylase AcuC [Mitsuaria sp. PDC51]|uniref:histone deacetylase family protein n=1 Tax=Mitsuaria sp. PDC51 TaxID=1881035 RepID=UPI0008EF324B|nr:histone deacetylase [Mitsuaria sp. PDC51]SFR73435.1 Acetoin utilization deacetylase AcuC [Mitsuaria sp. PDC51]